jgi:hypothetical protein
MIYAGVGFLAALIVILVFAIIWQVAKAKLDRWSYDLNRETHSQLFDAKLKLDSIVRGQERLQSQLERLERAVDTQRSTVSDLRARLSSPGSVS